MFGRYVNLLSIFFPCYFLIVVVFEGHKGNAIRMRSSIPREGYYVCRVGRYPLPCTRCLAETNKPSPYLPGSSGYDNTGYSPACAAETCLGNTRRGCRMRGRVSAASPSNPAFLTPSSDYVSEASLAGEWELRFHPDGPWEEMSALLADAKETPTGEKHVLLTALRELYRNAARRSFYATSVPSPLAPLSHPPVQLKLQSNRLGIPTDTRFPSVVWQLKRRPYSTLYIELEMAFLPDDPQFMLVFEAPVSPGKHFSQGVQVQEGTVSFAAAPFLPWQKCRIGKFTLTPKTLRTVVDPVLL